MNAFVFPLLLLLLLLFPHQKWHAKYSSRQHVHNLLRPMSLLFSGASSMAPVASLRKYASRLDCHSSLCIDDVACRGKELVTELYHTNTQDEQQNGHDHQRQHYQNDVDDDQ